MTKRRIGLFGGTFDPPHEGHLHFAKEMQKIHGFDEIWFFPTGQNPFKVEKKVTPPEVRLAMTKLAVEGIPTFVVRDDEVKRPGITYAIDTIRELQATYPEYDFTILIGNDAVPTIFKWKEVSELFSLVPFAVGPRTLMNVFENLQGDPKVIEALKRGWTATTLLPIASTEIRKRLQNGESVEEMVPRKVLDYISKNRLYS